MRFQRINLLHLLEHRLFLRLQPVLEQRLELVHVYLDGLRLLLEGHLEVHALLHQQLLHALNFAFDINVAVLLNDDARLEALQLFEYFLEGHHRLLNHALKLSIDDPLIFLVAAEFSLQRFDHGRLKLFVDLLSDLAGQSLL